MQYKRVLYYPGNDSLGSLPATMYVTKSDVLPAPVEKITKLTTNSFKDSISLTETVVKSKVFIRTITNSITLTENLVKKTTKVIANSLSLVEHIVPNKQQFRSFNDHLTLTESLSKIKVRMITIVDRINLVELVREFKNGVLVGKWTKINKPIATWIKQLKPL